MDNLHYSKDYAGPRTNSYLEEWHSRLKKAIEKSHPNIFELVNLMKKEKATGWHLRVVQNYHQGREKLKKSKGEYSPL